MRATILATVVLMTAAVQADTFGPGTHVVNGLIVSVPAGASVTIEAPTSVVQIGTTIPIPGDTPGPVDPTPDPTSTLAQSVKAAADLVTGDPKRAETAGALALVYREGAKLLADGSLKTTAQATKWAELGSDIALRQQVASTQLQHE